MYLIKIGWKMVTSLLFGERIFIDRPDSTGRAADFGWYVVESYQGVFW